jgi:aldehyde:ferredoxin oxidoreductase
VISTGGVIGSALEAAERRILKGDIGEEADLARGNGRGVANLVRKIGRQEGLGYLLGEGVVRGEDGAAGNLLPFSG